MLAVVVFAASPTVSLAQRSGSHFGSGSSGSIGRAGGTAQQSGSHFGIAQPPAAFAPTQAPATVTRTTFVANPSLTQAPVTVIQNPIVTPGPGFVPGQTFVPNPVSTPHPVFGSSRGFTPNPAFIPNQFAPPEGVFDLNPFQPQVTVPTHILDPGQTIIPTPQCLQYFP